MNWHVRLTAVVGLGFFAGCASWSVPAHVRMIDLLRIPSAALRINPLRWDLMDGQLVLRGSVEKRFEGPPTDHSHLRARFIDAAGVVLGEQIVTFSPQHLRRRIRPPHPRAEFFVPVPDLPTGVASIEVRAHDEPHLTG